MFAWPSCAAVLASPAGLEPATHSLGNCCSIRLSYGDRKGRKNTGSHPGWQESPAARGDRTSRHLISGFISPFASNGALDRLPSVFSVVLPTPKRRKPDDHRNAHLHVVPDGARSSVAVKAPLAKNAKLLRAHSGGGARIGCGYLLAAMCIAQIVLHPFAALSTAHVSCWDIRPNRGRTATGLNR